MIIYSDDPRGVHQAIKEELKKDPNAQIQLKRAENRIAVYSVVEASTEVLDDRATNIAKMTKKQLQEALIEKGVWFETDANKDRLVELLEAGE